MPRSPAGRNPATRDRWPRPAITSPPLLATPGGVTSCQRSRPAGRANSCQKLLCWAVEPPSTPTAHDPPATSVAVASDGGGGGPAGAPGLAACSKIVIGVTMGYMLLTMV